MAGSPRPLPDAAAWSGRAGELPSSLAQLLADHLASKPDLRCSCLAPKSGGAPRRLRVPRIWPWPFRCPQLHRAILGQSPTAGTRTRRQDIHVQRCHLSWRRTPKPSSSRPDGAPQPTGQEFSSSTGGEFPRNVQRPAQGRYPVCRHAWPRRHDGKLISHMAPREPLPWHRATAWCRYDPSVLAPGASQPTPHGLRHDP